MFVGECVWMCLSLPSTPTSCVGECETSLLITLRTSKSDRLEGLMCNIHLHLYWLGLIILPVLHFDFVSQTEHKCVCVACLTQSSKICFQGRVLVIHLFTAMTKTIQVAPGVSQARLVPRVRDTEEQSRMKMNTKLRQQNLWMGSQSRKRKDKQK